MTTSSSLARETATLMIDRPCDQGQSQSPSRVGRARGRFVHDRIVIAEHVAVVETFLEGVDGACDEWASAKESGSGEGGFPAPGVAVLVTASHRIVPDVELRSLRMLLVPGLAILELAQGGVGVEDATAVGLPAFIRLRISVDYLENVCNGLAVGEARRVRGDAEVGEVVREIGYGRPYVNLGAVAGSGRPELNCSVLQGRTSRTGGAGIIGRCKIPHGKGRAYGNQGDRTGYRRYAHER